MSDPLQRPNADACIDIETLAAYVDRTLAPDERRAVVEHLADCDACAELAVEVIQADEALGEQLQGGAAVETSPTSSSMRGAPPHGHVTRRSSLLVLGSALATAAVLVIIAGAAWLSWQRRDVSRSQLWPQLVAAAGAARATDGRLTGGFGYGAFRTPDRGISPSANLALIAAAGELQKAAEADPDAVNLHGWGVAQLALGEYDGGVASLELARLQHGVTARLAADLAAGYLARANTSDRPEDLPKALESAEEALRIEPTLAEAWFTKAIVLERLQMLQQARQAWESYLRLDPSSAWSTEARERLARLESRSSVSNWHEIERRVSAGGVDDRFFAEAVAVYGTDLRELLLEDLLPAWADRIASSDADRYLSRAAGVAAALERHANDDSFSRALTRMSTVPQVQRRMIVEGLQELGAGLRMQTEGRSPAEIRRRLEAAVSLLGPLNSGLHLWAELGLARLAWAAHAHEEVLGRARAIAQEAARDSSASLEARAHWLLGMTAFTTGNWAEAHRHYERGLQLCAESNDSGLAATLHVNAAVLNRFLGNRRGTWLHRLAAAEVLPLHRPLHVHTYLTSGAVTASMESLPQVALLFQNEVVENAASNLPTGPRAEARISRARMLARLHRLVEADSDLTEARALVAAVDTDPMKVRLTRAWLLAAAEVHLSEHPAEAARYASEALALISASREPARMAEAALLESRALARLGEVEAALSSAKRGMEAFEASLASIDARDASRLSAVEPVWALYSHGSRLELTERRMNLPGAFQIVERGRARTLLDLRRIEPLTLADVRRRLDPSEGVLLLDQADDDLITWWITSTSVRTMRSAVSADAIERLITQHRRSLEADQRRHPSSAKLFDLAIRPWWDELRSKTTIAVIPDGPWSRVAWPALWDAQSNTELVFGAGIVIAPSASVALLARHPIGTPIDSVLVIAAPATGIERELPGARAESRAIARLYPASRLIERAEATPAKLIQGAATADVVHVSSHAVDVSGYPQLSYLLLSGEGDRGKLFVRDLAPVDLSRTRLVVLAACSTAGRTAVRGEGSVGVAWGFLTAGVRQVIATLQEIEDGPAQELFSSIHRRIAAGETPARALQMTQRELAAAGESPRLWAAVTLLGALH